MLSAFTCLGLRVTSQLLELSTLDLRLDWLAARDLWLLASLFCISAFDLLFLLGTAGGSASLSSGPSWTKLLDLLQDWERPPTLLIDLLRPRGGFLSTLGELTSGISA